MLATGATSCTWQGGKSGSAATQAAAPKPRSVPAELPDTAYPSADVIKYNVEIDDSTSPRVDLSKQYYDGDDVLTFRKNPLRNADFGGRVKGTPDSVAVAWEFETATDNRKTKFGVWTGGSGWTGQPLYLKKSNEIVVGSLCSRVYFIDFNTGKATRPSLDCLNPIKGTVSKDPELPLLYVGQGVPAAEPFGKMAWNIDTRKLVTPPARDPKALRGWNGNDGCAVVVGDFLFWASENGSFYKYRRSATGGLQRAAVLRYTVNGSAPGTENSLCVYSNYGFFGDNHGNVICVNLNTMKPVWRYDLHDDIDASIVCQVEGGKPYLYAACEVDKLGPIGQSHIVKLNALNGEQVWETHIECKQLKLGEKTLDGGVYCTPLLGHGDCEGLLFANVCRNSVPGAKSAGEFTAFSTRDGHIVYVTPLRTFAWSSPVAFYNERNECFILTGDSEGNVYLLRGKTGEILYKKHIAANFESSPVVVGNAAVVGSRQNGIYKLVVQ